MENPEVSIEELQRDLATALAVRTKLVFLFWILALASGISPVFYFSWPWWAAALAQVSAVSAFWTTDKYLQGAEYNYRQTEAMLMLTRLQISQNERCESWKTGKL